MTEISKHLRGPWVAVLSHRGDIFDSLSEAVACGVEEVDIRVVRGTAAPVDGAFPSGSTLTGDELYRLDDVWIEDDDDSDGAAARWEQAQAVAAGLNAAGASAVVAVTIERPDDEHIEVHVNGTVVASANYDEHGWSGMSAVVATALAVGRAFDPAVNVGG